MAAENKLNGKIQIHIVDSVKGGSGKSTFAAKLCMNLSEIKDKKACVIDLDILGTSWWHIYSNYIENLPVNNKMIYLNDIIEDFDYYVKKFFIYNIKFYNGYDGKNTEIQVVLSSPHPKDKYKYKVNADANALNISYDWFYSAFEDLIEYLKKDGFTDVILDMPPNSEPYSDQILHTCLHTNSKHNVNLYMVSCINKAHMESTFKWYEAAINDGSSMHIVSPKYINVDPKKYASEKVKFFYVFNETRAFRNDSHLSISDIESILSKQVIARQLYYYFVGFDAEYSKLLDEQIIGLKKHVSLVPFDNSKFYTYNTITELTKATTTDSLWI